MFDLVHDDVVDGWSFQRAVMEQLAAKLNAAAPATVREPLTCPHCGPNGCRDTCPDLPF